MFSTIVVNADEIISLSLQRFQVMPACFCLKQTGKMTILQPWEGRYRTEIKKTAANVLPSWRSLYVPAAL